MCKCEEYAGKLRIGEKNRDASDKIRGFIYQDLLAIDLILNSKEEDKIYVEWVEDIFIENANTISIYQVKHYPKSHLQFQEIYENMFYQFLKFKLYETEKREVKTYCIYHAETYNDFNKTETLRKIKKENDTERINKLDIENRLENCGNMEQRKGLIFDKIASKNFHNEFDFQKREKKDIKDTRKSLKGVLYNTFKADEHMFQMRKKENIEDILLAIAIQYIQESYYNKLEDYEERCMTRASFYEYMNRIVGVDGQKCTERIKFIVLGYVDKVFSEIITEIENPEIANTYKEIYFSTKHFFVEKLGNKEKRFKFLNTISTDEYKELNRENYIKNIAFETDRFLEHKYHIDQFIKITWKILYDIDCKDFGNFIKENDEYFFFEFPEEKVRPVIILSPKTDTIREASKTLNRILKMKIKPRKWYFEGKLKGVYEYSFKVNKIRETELNGQFSFLYKQQDCFNIECMDCIKFDEGEMEIKDVNLDNGLFDFKCTKGC